LVAEIIYIATSAFGTGTNSEDHGLPGPVVYVPVIAEGLPVVKVEIIRNNVPKLKNGAIENTIH
jgi:hypothetical protein